MTKGDIKRINCLQKKIEGLYKTKHERYTDLYYRYAGKTYVKTMPNKKAFKVILSTTANISADDGHDTDTSELLFACSSSGTDPCKPTKKIDLYRVILDSAMQMLGITEKEKRQWLDALITKN